MGIAIPQVITPSRATGAQVIDGSLNFFQESNPYLEFTPGSDGNRSTWTISFWAKVNSKETGTYNPFTLSTSDSYAWEYEGLHYAGNNLYYIDYISQGSGANILWRTNAKFRDTGWYHFMAVKVNNSTFKLYVNGEELTDLSSSTNNGGQSSHWNKSGQKMFLGGSAHSTGYSSHSPGMSQFYFIDGQALEPADFAFTDPLTNTWKPKKYTGTFTGTNTCYLPFDGNSPIGQDQSGNGNNWTPVNFGGSVELDKATGAKPILNTTQGGAQAGFGVFGSKQNVGYAVTVYNPTGSQNRYYLDGVEAPTLTGLIRGATYTFDQSDSTNGTHPLVFGTTAEGNNFNKTATTGASAGSAGAATTITIPYDGPNTIYYHCSAHSGMGGNITGITTNEKLADQYASHCVLAVPLIGGDDDVCASIACTANNKTPTNSSVAASSAQSNFYSGSHYWSANSDTLQYAEQGQELVFNTGDFTIECWVYDDDGHSGSGGRCYIFDSRIGGSVVGDPPQVAAWVDGSNEFNFNYSAGTISVTVPTTVGKWWHFAATREGTTIRLFIDGILRGSATDSTNFPNNGIGIGRATDANYGWAGYIQDFRVYRGVAKYTSNFVPAATSPDILPDTPSGVSGGSKLTKITDGAVSFDGTNDTLSVPDHADFTFGSGDFTLEAFVYNRSSGYRSIVMKYGGSPSTSSWFWSMYNGQNQFYYYSGGNEPAVTSGQTHYNKWVHCAVSREGNTIRIFDNGELTGTLDVSSYATMNDSTVPLDIGADYADNYDMDGFISNVRIVKGTALYTKNFTPPTAPLTNVTNTKLLCCQSNTSAGAAVTSPNMGGINDGTIWSDYLTTTQGTTPTDFYYDAYPAEFLFDGDTSNPVYGGWTDDADDNSDIIFRPPSGISVSSKLEVYVGYYDKIKVNGTTYNTGGESTDVAWVTVSDGSNFTGTLTELILENTTNANVVRASAIRIDDSTILLDPVTVNGHAVATTFNPFNTDINTVRGQETGQVTLNPLSTSEATLTNGNLDYSSSSNMHTVTSTISVSSGKWYWENQRVSGGSHYYVGIADVDTNVYGNWTGSRSGYSWSVNTSGSICHNNAEGGDLGSVSSIAGSDKVIGWALDMDEGTLVIYANGKPVIPSSITSPNSKNPNSIVSTDDLVGSAHTTRRRISPAHGHSSHRNMRYNFGQKPFKYAPPDGFQPLNAANLRPVKVIPRPDQYVGITTWSGTAATHSITGLNFNAKPDLVWLKEKSSTSDHGLWNSVMGQSEYNSSNATQGHYDTTTEFTSFDYNGFTLGNNTMTNQSGQTYVAWCWKAGGDKNTFNIDHVGYSTAGDVNMSVGDLNSTAFNTSAIWSGMMSGPSNSGVYTNLFDGTDGPSGGYEQPTNGNTLTFTPTGGITASTSIEIYVFQSADTYSSSADITVNGKSIKTTAVNSTLGTGSAYGYVNIGTKSLTTLTWSNPSGSNNDYRLMAIRVDGKILLDSNQTAPNVPTIDATGCSVGTKQGFSIIKYTGTGTAGSIAHGLSEQPTFVMIKDLKNSNSWAVQHVGTTLGRGLLKLDTTAASDNSVATQVWNSTSPSSYVFHVGTAGDVNYTTNSAEYIAYLWHDVPGLQKFGSYEGNEDTGGDGPFVELGFRPAIIWIKNSEQGTSAADWVIYDSERNKFNPSGKQLYPNRNIAEADDSNHQFDILSNGFKVRSTSTSDLTNATDTYIYCAWAAAPSVDLFGGGANAR